MPQTEIYWEHAALEGYKPVLCQVLAAKGFNFACQPHCVVVEDIMGKEAILKELVFLTVAKTRPPVLLFTMRDEPVTDTSIPPKAPLVPRPPKTTLKHDASTTFRPPGKV